jgi:hypothetical protein
LWMFTLIVVVVEPVFAPVSGSKWVVDEEV